MSALRPGDLVLSDAGIPCRVIAATEVMIGHDCYSVEFDDGAEIVADADHLWKTEQRSKCGTGSLRGVPKAEWKTGWQFGLRTTREIAATLRYKNGKYQSANHSVQLSGALTLPEASLPLPPYTLGAWLGDGDSDSARVTVAVSDWQIVQEIEADGVKVIEQARHAPHIARVSLSGGVRNKASQIACTVLTAALANPTVTAPSIVASSGHDQDRVSRFLSSSGFFECVEKKRGLGDGGGAAASVWRLREDSIPDAERIVAEPLPFLVRLRDAGLLGDKHIPVAYLRASLGQRLSLVQGLMDTDGTIAESGQCEFTSTNFWLAAGLRELIVSLRIKPFMSAGRATLNGRDVGEKWRVIFDPPSDVPVFRLQRKLARQIKRHDRRRLAGDRRITNCCPVPSVPVKCISVNSPSRMFLAGLQMVPTHNSPTAAGIGMYCPIADGEARAEVYAAASKKDPKTDAGFVP
jgi:replicative DNA helicase